MRPIGEVTTHVLGIRSSLIAVTIALYAVSFFLPVFDANERTTMYGYEGFLWGLLYPPYLPMWCANPLFWFGCARYVNRQWSAARNAGIAAFALAVSEVWMWDDSPEIGYFAWVASMATLAISAVVAANRSAGAPDTF